jgi:hypothetical protein
MAKQLISFMIEILKRQRAPAFPAQRSALLCAGKNNTLLTMENKH